MPEDGMVKHYEFNESKCEAKSSIINTICRAILE